MWRPLLVGAFALPSLASAQVLREELWVTDGAVEAIAVSNGVIYLGGGFSLVGPVTPGGSLLDGGSGAALPPYLDVEGVVAAVAPDLNGGWYLGGAFTAVQGQPRANLAQVDAAGHLTSWDPAPNGAIKVLQPSIGTLYAGGEFTTIGGQPRTYIAAFDPTTGALTAWNPNADAVVNALAVSGSTVYAGGGFLQIGGSARNRIAALDAATGVATSWNPNADSDVVSLAVNGGKVYAGGFFNTIGGQPRSGLAALDAASGAATAWNPGADGPVQALAVHQRSTSPFTETVYAGGFFTLVGGQPRSYIAAVDGATGSATSWNPSANGGVWTLTFKSNFSGTVTTVYAGGDFTTIGGQPRNYIAALDGAGAATAWNPNANGSVLTLSLGLGTVFIGGTFTSTGRQPRSCLAALDAATGAVTGWNPSPSGPVRALVASGSTVYAGGTFASIGGDPLTLNLAALDAATGAVLSQWDADPILPGDVHDLALQGSTLYVAGEFAAIGGQLRSHLAAVDATTGAATNWNAQPNGAVYAVAVAERTSFPFTRTIYAGGEFGTIGGQTRISIGAVDGSTGVATSWNPVASSDVYDLLLTTDPFGNVTSVYAGGLFTTIGGQLRNHIAELNASGAATAWNPNANLNGSVHALARGGNTIYAGGSFVVIGNQWRTALAALDASTGAATSWDPGLAGGGPVYAVALAASELYAGGSFPTVAGEPHSNIAGFRDPLVGAPELPAAGASSDEVRAWPNPFRAAVTLQFAVPNRGDVAAEVYDVAGRRVRTLRRAFTGAGEHQLTWDGRTDAGESAAVGLYVVRLRGESLDATAKVMRIR